MTSEATMESCREIYKYVRPERLDVLTSGLIRFTQPTALNDPFELHPYFDLLIRDEELLASVAHADPIPHLTAMYKELPAETRRVLSLEQLIAFAGAYLSSPAGLSTTKDVIEELRSALPLATPKIRQQLTDHFGSTVGILSLSEDPTNLVMWAHYADNHRGFVFQFDRGNTFFDHRRGPNDEFYHLRQVVYRAPKQQQALVELDGDAILVSKRPEWSYEREWRILAPLSASEKRLHGPDGDIHLFPLPPASLVRIILGARASHHLEKAIRATIVHSPPLASVRVVRAVLDDSSGVVVIPD